MKTLLAILTAVAAFGTMPLQGQEFHSMAEIYKILEESKLTYTIAGFDDSTNIEDTVAPILVAHGWYEAESEDGQYLTNYQAQIMANALLNNLYNAGEHAFEQRDYGAARKAYVTILKDFPYNSQVLTYIAQTYEMEDDYDTALEYLERAVDANRLDYMAHWFYADNLARKGEAEKAMEHITLAHLLNRNNPRILTSLKEIYKANNRTFLDWEIQPRYKLRDAGEHRRSVFVDLDSELRSAWLGYALCKALWTYEPGYKESMIGENSEMELLIEEKECLLSMLTAYLNAKEGKDPIEPDDWFEKLLGTVEAGHTSSYIMYATLLKSDPELAMRISEENLENLSEYMIEFHSTEAE